MTEHNGKRCPADRTRVNVTSRDEIKFWANHFGISRRELKEAVDAVGVAVTTVGHFLRRRRAAGKSGTHGRA